MDREIDLHPRIIRVEITDVDRLIVVRPTETESDLPGPGLHGSPFPAQVDPFVIDYKHENKQLNKILGPSKKLKQNCRKDSKNYETNLYKIQNL